MTEDFDTRADELAVNIEAKIAESAAIIANTDFDPQYRRMAEADMPSAKELFSQ